MRYWIIIILLALNWTLSYADKWHFEPEKKDIQYDFGETTIILTYDTLENQNFPKYTLKILTDGKLMATHNGIGFEKLHASPDNRFFLGVSNRGTVKHAYVIFNSEGRLIKLARHEIDFKPENYCEISISVVRKWYNEDHPNVRFKMVDDELYDVMIERCDERDWSLIRDNRFKRFFK